jgi:hypothetical protein
MPTATIEVTRVSEHLHFSISSDPSGTLTIMDSVEIQVAPVGTDTSYTITFLPAGLVTRMDSVSVTDESGNPVPAVNFDLDAEISGFTAEFSYPENPPVANEAFVEFEIHYHFELDDPLDIQVLPDADQDPTFIFKPPSEG